MSRISVASFFMLLLVAAAFVLLPAGHQAAAQAHTPYKCYQLLGTVPPGVPPVNLETQFGVEPAVVVGPAQFLCQPAMKNGEGDLTQTPYKAYMIADTHTPNVRVNLQTQFGLESRVLVGQAKLLLEPALVNGVGDPTQTPYKCYQITDTHNPNVPVELVTMFPPEPPIVEPNVLVGPAQYLCEPAEKNGVGDLTASPYKCYGISNTVPPPVPPLVVETQFGIEQFPPMGEVTAAQLLCEPAIKNPSVGGIAELPEAASDSGWPTGTYAALAGGIAAAVFVLSAGAWYARRRLS